MSAAGLDEIDEIAAAIVMMFLRAAAVPVLPYLRAEHAERLEREVVAPLHDAIGGALGAIAALELELEGQDAAGVEWGALEPTGDEPAHRLGRMLGDELWQQVADVCFAARGELRRAERTLRPHAAASQEDRLAASETAHRKLRRALGAVLEALGRARNQAFPVLAERVADAESAAAVRRMYARFRRSLMRCDAADPANVRRALRHAAVSIAVMVGGNEFSDVRASDRALLVELQGRILRWARDGASHSGGVGLYRDIVTTAELLRAINLRRELAAHDQRMQRAAAAALADPEPAAAIAAAAPALHALDGCDGALDAALVRALREPPSHDLVAELRTAVAALGAADGQSRP